MILTILLDSFYVYLAMGPGRSLRAVSERFDIPERELCHRARRERWDERIPSLAIEILNTWSLPVLTRTCQQIHLGLALEAATRIGAPVPGFRLGFTSLGTQLLVQLQRTEGPSVPA